MASPASWSTSPCVREMSLRLGVSSEKSAGWSAANRRLRPLEPKVFVVVGIMRLIPSRFRLEYCWLLCEWIDATWLPEYRDAIGPWLPSICHCASTSTAPLMQHSVAQPFGVALAPSRQLNDADGHYLARALVVVNFEHPTH